MPATNVNDAIRDLEIRHQVNVQRLSTGVLGKLRTILDRADIEIVELLVKRGAATQGTFTSKRLAALLDAIRTINRDVHTELGKSLRKELKDIGAYELNFQKKLLEGVLPIKWDIVTPTVEMLEAVVVSKPFQGKLLKEWVSELDANKSRRLRDAIRMGVVQGETIDQIVRRVRGTRAMGYRDGIMEMGRRGAEALVRTSVAHTTTEARNILYDKNKDLIAKEQWVATLDTRTCPQCMGLDGKTFLLGEGTETPAHIGCRCVRVPVTKSWKELGFDIDELPPGTRASMNGQVSATETYGSWLKKQGADVQDDVLGPTRGKMFREGAVQIDGFTNDNGKTLTLDQLRAKEGLSTTPTARERAVEQVDSMTRYNRTMEIERKDGSSVRNVFPLAKEDLYDRLQEPMKDAVRQLQQSEALTTVRLSELQTFQNGLSFDNLRSMVADGILPVRSWEEPIVVSVNGKMIIWDGNHRLAARKLLGEKTADVKLTFVVLP